MMSDASDHEPDSSVRELELEVYELDLPLAVTRTRRMGKFGANSKFLACLQVWQIQRFIIQANLRDR